MSVRFLVAVAGVSLGLAGCSAPVEAGDPVTAPNPPATESTPPEPTGDATSTPPGVAAFGEVYTYDDGLAVTVTDVTRFQPDPYLLEGLELPADTVGVKYVVRVENGTGAAYDANLLSTSTLVGEAGEPAPPLCDMNIDCFAAQTVPPGRNVTVTYGVAVPPADTGLIGVQVSPDFEHESVLREGSVPA